MRTLGILGGGQLGRMLALAARPLELAVLTLDPHAETPCGQVAQAHVQAAFDDIPAVTAFAARCDFVTFEFENIPPATIAALETAGVIVAPSSHVLKITQDRVFEKEFVRGLGLQTAPFVGISHIDEVDAALATVGFPAIIKTRHGGYDGKGQWRIETIAAARAVCEERAARTPSGNLDLIVEGVVQFERELSVIATRGRDGTFITFPIAENRHENGILAQTQAPAIVSETIAQVLIDVAARIAAGFHYVGTFAVETFLCNGEIIINEIAPRVHNSGHYTLEATSLSQFSAHVRAVCDFPLSSPLLLSPATMLNILGDGTGDDFAGFAAFLAEPGVALHLYGKGRAAAGRKMGHATILRPTLAEAAATAQKLRPDISWRK